MRLDAVDTFRRLVALLYREIGVLEPRNHQALASKRRVGTNFFPGDRKAVAKQVYQQTKEDSNPESTGAELERITGLSLDDIRLAFCEGEWKNSRGNYSYGGPKWCQIARAAMELRDALRSRDQLGVEQLLTRVRGLRHNNGFITDKFPQLD